ncbi:uncharacterized protein LOC113793458 [Dermatophagoides pteronyssinus]|uniref:Uncharacterized protein LOC113793458 n=1 Tax=Dermatophagoides pteronyssinus TaxID=6956 RepID=A0A6P6Y2I1_DERPT|nr:uncharacterized protein LOC113793458 [Dermatophagoides pteronyssinus]
MLKLVPAIVDTRDFSNISSSINLNETNRRNTPFVCHIPTPYSCSIAAASSSHQRNNIGLQNSDSPLTQCVWTFFWLAVLIFIGYPLGFFAGQLYLLISPLTSIDFCNRIHLGKLSSSLLWTMHLPLICSQNMIAAKALIDSI